MENTEKTTNPLDEIYRLSRQLGNIENLQMIKEMVSEVLPKKFFTSKEDENIKGIYHIFVDGEFSHTVKLPDSDNQKENIKAYLSVAELSFKRGCAYILEKMVDKLAEKTKNA